MPNKKISEMTEQVSDPHADDLFEGVDVSDTTGAATGTNKKHKWSTLRSALKTFLDTYYQPLATVLTNTTASFTTADESKLDGIEEGAEVNTVDTVNGQSGTVSLDADDISDTSTTNKFATAAEKTKLGHISVTQAVDLDTIESRVNALDAAVVLTGSWDASTGSFPGGGSAQAGESYIVSTGGTVDGIEFVANDRIVAITDNASTSTYASNWLKLDYTDAVLSVNGQTGAASLDADDIDDTSTTNKFTTASDISKLSNIEANADVTDAVNVGSSIHGATAKTTPVDADTMPLIDSAASNVLKKITWANIKAAIKSYYDNVTSTMTNKTIDGDNNTLQDIPYSAIKQAAWSTWTPTYTGITIGNGTVNGKYIRLGRLIIAVLSIGVGSTTSITNNHRFTLPVTADSIYTESNGRSSIGVVSALDFGAGTYTGQAIIVDDTDEAGPFWPDGAGGTTTVFPINEANGDHYSVNLIYLAAS